MAPNVFQSQYHTPTPGSAEPRAARQTRWSFLMLAMIIPAAIVSAIISMVLLNQRGLDGSEPMSVQGSYGWFVRILGNIVILLAPAYAGLTLGIMARRHGGGRRALVAVVLNAVIIAAVWLAVALSG
jgi:hypothetical protein